MGPVVQGLYDLAAPRLLEELEIWSVGTLPLTDLPPSSRRASGAGPGHHPREHYLAGGLGEALGHLS
jgi:hypothetical protein